ncbi:MAG: hypothetical protein R2707_00270 [Acidimicrobiales bacterium]
MRWTEIRGVVAVAVAIAAIAFAWTTIESHGTTDSASTVTTTTTTTTTTVAPTTTRSQDENNLLVCERARSFVDEVAEVPAEAGPGPVAVLALSFWEDVYALTTGGARAEVVAVVSYYQDYIETAGPFDYDTSRIIVEGDKEKLQQLITRPAPGFEGSRGFIAFGCGVEVPAPPRMDADDFDDLEDRLLDDEDDT